MSYEQMAMLYDQLMEDAPYDSWVSFTEDVLHKYGKKAHRVIDLGCGTGEITTKMAEKGYHLVGVDYSAEMLTIAEQKSSESKLPIHWLHKDVRSLEGLEDFDVAISYCDVINYITELNDLEDVFQNVAQLLKKGGLFLFDIHSMYHVKNNLINHTFADVTENSSYIWFCAEGDDEGEMFHELTFYSSRDNQLYTRFDESHHQRTYPVETYIELLKKAGFINLNIFGDFSLDKENLTEKSERIFIIAEKRSG